MFKYLTYRRWFKTVWNMTLCLYWCFRDECYLHLHGLHRHSVTCQKFRVSQNISARTSSLIHNLKCEKGERLWIKICISEFRQEDASEWSHYADGRVHGGDIWQWNWTVSGEMPLYPCLAACLLNGGCYHHVTATEHVKIRLSASIQGIIEVLFQSQCQVKNWGAGLFPSVDLCSND